MRNKRYHVQRVRFFVLIYKICIVWCTYAWPILPKGVLIYIVYLYYNGFFFGKVIVHKKTTQHIFKGLYFEIIETRHSLDSRIV